jgi:hypothetical protein
LVADCRYNDREVRPAPWPVSSVSSTLHDAFWPTELDMTSGRTFRKGSREEESDAEREKERERESHRDETKDRLAERQRERRIYCTSGVLLLAFA